LQRLNTTFRAGAPQFNVTVDRIKAETLGITVGNVFSALSTYVGSNYAAQFNKFGHVFQLYTQALPEFRATADDIRNLKVKAGNGTMTPIGTVVDIKEVQGPLLISLYNLYPSATVVGSPAPGFSSGEALDIMDQIGQQALPPGTGYEWTAMSYQEKAVGSQIYFVFGLAMLLVYFVLAGQYESWILPLSVILCVPLALLGTVGALTALGAANNLYTQIGLILLIALGSKNAILIVEYARQQAGRGDGDRRCGGGGSPAQVPAHSHDLFRLHPGRLPACHCDRRGRRGAPFDRHRGLQRHDRLDLPRRRVRSLILCRDAAHAGAMDGPRRAPSEQRRAEVFGLKLESGLASAAR
jgi:multidrug efflux pump subunit AcrB